MEIEVRPAKKEDLDFLIEAQRAMAEETENMVLKSETLTSGIQHLFDYPAMGGYLLAVKGDSPVGCTLTLNEWSDWRNGTVIWIHSVYVKPEFRKMGVFKKIYSHLQEKVMKNPALKGLRLYVDQSNFAAQEVYKKLGMNGEHYKLYEWLPEG